MRPGRSEAPDIAEQQTYYNAYFRDRQHINNLKLARCIAILDAILKAGLREPQILDLGCGRGWLTTILGHIGPTVGVDLSDEAIQSAAGRFPNARFEQADILSWSPPEANFDIVVSQEVIEHIEDQAAYLEVAYRALKPGGWLILTTPNARTFRAMPEDQRSAWANQPIENWRTPAELRALASGRFEIVRLTTLIPHYGSRGIYRALNSHTLQRLLRTVRLLGPFQSARLRLGYGLHILLVARKPEVR